MTFSPNNQPRPASKPNIGNFEKFTLPAIRKVSPSLVDLFPQEVPKTPLQQFTEEVFAEECRPEPPKPLAMTAVGPMSMPVGGIAFYRPRYGAKQK